MKSRSVNARGHTIAFFLGCKSKKKATMDLLGGFGQHTCTVTGWLAARGAGRLASRLASRLAGQQPLSVRPCMDRTTAAYGPRTSGPRTPIHGPRTAPAILFRVFR